MKKERKNIFKVAVIGCGASGISCAYRLQKLGIQTDVYERSELLGGLANGTKIAKGEVVMVGEKFGIRFTEVADPEELIDNL